MWAATALHPHGHARHGALFVRPATAAGADDGTGAEAGRGGGPGGSDSTIPRGDCGRVLRDLLGEKLSANLEEFAPVLPRREDVLHHVPRLLSFLLCLYFLQYGNCKIR